jgi:hypothetical protein
VKGSEVEETTTLVLEFSVTGFDSDDDDEEPELEFPTELEDFLAELEDPEETDDVLRVQDLPVRGLNKYSGLHPATAVEEIGLTQGLPVIELNKSPGAQFAAFTELVLKVKKPNKTKAETSKATVYLFIYLYIIHPNVNFVNKATIQLFWIIHDNFYVFRFVR